MIFHFSRAIASPQPSAMSPSPHVTALPIAITLISILFLSAFAAGQGCVAAHTDQPVVTGLSSHDMDFGKFKSKSGDHDRFTDALHNLTVTVGFRTYSSYAHYVGTVYQAQRAAAHNQVLNHVDLYDVQINYQLIPCWSIIADVPSLTASRRQQGNGNVYRSGRHR